MLFRLLDQTFVPAISVPLFVEYEATLLRSENLLNRDAATVESFLDFLLSLVVSYAVKADKYAEGVLRVSKTSTTVFQDHSKRWSTI